MNFTNSVKPNGVIDIQMRNPWRILFRRGNTVGVSMPAEAQKQSYMEEI